MKTHTKTYTTWTIDEHPDPAACLDWMRENLHYLYGWHDENADSLSAFCEHFSLSGLDYEYSMHRPSYASARVPDDLSELSGYHLRRHLRINGLLAYRKANGKLAELLAGDCPFTGYCMDESLLEPLRDFIAYVDSRDYQTLINDCLHNWVRDCIADWEYQYSDEGLTELAQANEYEFLEDGSVF